MMDVRSILDIWHSRSQIDRANITAPMTTRSDASATRAILSNADTTGDLVEASIGGVFIGTVSPHRMHRYLGVSSRNSRLIGKKITHASAKRLPRVLFHSVPSHFGQYVSDGLRAAGVASTSLNRASPTVSPIPTSREMASARLPASTRVQWVAPVSGLTTSTSNIDRMGNSPTSRPMRQYIATQPSAMANGGRP